MCVGIVLVVVSFLGVCTCTCVIVHKNGTVQESWHRFHTNGPVTRKRVVFFEAGKRKRKLIVHFFLHSLEQIVLETKPFVNTTPFSNPRSRLRTKSRWLKNGTVLAN